MNRNIINRSILILSTVIFAAGCTQGMADEADVESNEEGQTFGGPGFEGHTKQTVDPGDVVDTDRNVECDITVDPESVVPPRTVMGVARSICIQRARAQCTESEVGGVGGLVLYAGTTFATCDGYECSMRGVVQCLYNIGSN
jgi:hypothetical protein